MANIIKPTGINQLWAAGGTKVNPGLLKSNIGWVVELPPYQYQNWIDNRQDTIIAHINQHGIPEWDSETEYQGNLSYTQGSDGMIYKCISTHTNLNPVNPLNSLYWARAFETYGSVAVVQNQLTQHLNNYATLSGISNTVAARNNLSVYSRVESDSRFAPFNGNSSTSFNVGNATAATHAVPLGQLTSLLLGATETSAGQISLATIGETEIGTNDTKAITPLKASTVLLKKSGNLAGLGNVATARSNLGLSDIVTLPSNTFLRVDSNLADVPNKAVARNNLGLGDIAIQSINSFLQTGLNLADVPNKQTARNNLGLGEMATFPTSNVMFKTDNLAGITNQGIARNNLGLSDVVTYPANTWLTRAGNLAELANVQAARNNLGLTSIVTKNVIGMQNPEGDIVFTNVNDSSRGGTKLPNGFIMNYGYISAGGSATFAIPFTSATSYSVTVTHGPDARGAPGSGLGWKRADAFSLSYGVGGYQYTAMGW